MATAIEATYKIVTPLFSAGTDPGHAELRLPSFKGVLRFWWRALAWSRCDGDLAEIKQQEDALFGSAGAGQSRILMRLVGKASIQPITVGTVLKVPSTNTTVGEGARYLGYGVMEAFGSRKKNTQDGQLARACLLAPIEFTVSIRARDLTRDQIQSLKQALIAVGMLGGIGAKSRKGYGSLVLRSLRVDDKDAWTAPEAVDDLRGAIARLYPQGTSDELPEFTALSKRTRHVLLSSGRMEPVELLDLVGREIVRFRSWGRNGKILGGRVDSEKLFEDDHDLMKQQVGKRQSHPRRIAFGLPHNYGKPSDQQVNPHDRQLDRRASSMFIHIHECGQASVAVVSFLPARFLPVDREGKIFACLGLALEIFSRYSRVEKASGERVELREYLDQVWAAVAREALSLIFEDADATGLEEDARLTAMWLWTLSTSVNGGGNGGSSTAADDGADAEGEDDEEEGASKAKPNAGFSLEFDAARKIAQGLGAHIEDLGRVVEIKGDQARLLSVAERTRHLFGKDQAQRAPARRGKKEQQLTLFEEVEAAEQDADWGDVDPPPLGETTLDRVHQAMILFAAGRGEALKRFLVEEGVGRASPFWRLAQSLSTLYPAGTDEKRWVDGVLARKKGLGFG